jgi:hypothetical protein
MQNSYGTNFDAPDPHFNKLWLFRDILLRLIKYGNPNCYDYKNLKKSQTECHEMDQLKPNLSKDRAMHDQGDHSLF